MKCLHGEFFRLKTFLPPKYGCCKPFSFAHYFMRLQNHRGTPEIVSRPSRASEQNERASGRATLFSFNESHYFIKYQNQRGTPAIVSGANKIRTLSAKRSSGGACVSRPSRASEHNRAKCDPFSNIYSRHNTHRFPPMLLR